MHEICVIGDKSSVLGFKALGYTVYEASDIYEARKLFEENAGKFAIVFITERFAVKMTDMTEKFRKSKIPAVIPIPGGGGRTGLGGKIMKDAMERAVGADILFKDQ